MTRPRWHDAMIVIAIIGLLAAGVWALWWDDVREAVFGKPKPEMTTPNATTPTAPGT